MKWRETYISSWRIPYKWDAAPKPNHSGKCETRSKSRNGVGIIVDKSVRDEIVIVERWEE